MGALIMFGLVSVIAIVGVIYFNHKDKKIYEKAHKILSNVQFIVMKLDEKKLAKLKATNQQLNEKYGEHGTDTREKFNEKSMAWYYGDILRERRKELKLTQKQLAQKNW